MRLLKAKPGSWRSFHARPPDAQHVLHVPSMIDRCRKVEFGHFDKPDNVFHCTVDVVQGEPDLDVFRAFVLASSQGFLPVRMSPTEVQRVIGWESYLSSSALMACTSSSVSVPAAWRSLSVPSNTL